MKKWLTIKGHIPKSAEKIIADLAGISLKLVQEKAVLRDEIKELKRQRDAMQGYPIQDYSMWDKRLIFEQGNLSIEITENLEEKLGVVQHNFDLADSILKNYYRYDIKNNPGLL